MMEIEIRIEKDGEIIHRQKGNSLLKQFFQTLYILFSSTSQTVTLITGSTYSSSSSSGHFRNPAIIVGSGTTPVEGTDYKIESELTGISYGSVGMSITGTDTVCSIELYRVVADTSGTNRTINEIAVYTDFYSSSYRICIDRTVLSSPITLPANGSVTIYWALKQTY